MKLVLDISERKKRDGFYEARCKTEDGETHFGFSKRNINEAVANCLDNLADHFREDHDGQGEGQYETDHRSG